MLHRSNVLSSISSPSSDRGKESFRPEQAPRQPQNSRAAFPCTTPPASRASNPTPILSTPKGNEYIGKFSAGGPLRAATLNTSLSTIYSRGRAASPLRPKTVAEGIGSEDGGRIYASPHLAPPPASEDKNVLLHVHYGSRVIFRGPRGVTLTARPAPNSDVNSSTATSTPAGGPNTPGGGMTVATCGMGSSGQNAVSSFAACTEGRGVGEARESLTLVNYLRRDDRGPIAYGASVAVRCSWAKEKFLGVHSSTGAVGFWRTLIGAGEKWILMRPDLITSARNPGNKGGETGAGPPAPHSQSSQPRILGFSPQGLAGDAQRGQASGWVSGGESVVLQALSSREVLHVTDSAEWGTSLTLCAPDMALLSHAAWLITPAGTPLYPSWNLERPYLAGPFALHPQRHRLSPLQEELFKILPHAANREEAQYAPRPLGDCGPGEQERLLVEDLLWVVQGFEGKYVRAASLPCTAASIIPNDFRFELAESERESLEPGLSRMVENFLPLGGQCMRLRRFIDRKRRYDYGMVAQALAAGLQDLWLKGYGLLLAQLEFKHKQHLQEGRGAGHGLTLQQLWFHLQPALRSLEGLDALCQAVGQTKGGALLNKLRAAGAGCGDDRSAQTHAYLLEKAAGPYMAMLEKWICRGVLEDPYGEFMVKEEQGLSKENVQEDFNAEYWDARSTICAEHVFSVLEEHKPRILTTGKYLNVIRECGLDPGLGLEDKGSNHSGVDDRNSENLSAATSLIPKLRFSEGKAALGKAIDAAYHRACKLLLDVVLREHRLLARLASIKHYFLLDKGDFFVHFMNTAEKELLRGVWEVSSSRLEGLLHLSIQMSVASNDPYKDDISGTFSKKTLIEHLNAIHKSDRFGSVLTGGDGLNTSLSGAASAGRGSTYLSMSSHVPSSSFSSESPETELPELPDLLEHVNIDSATSRVKDPRNHPSELRGIKAYEAFMLETQVKWPLSLVVSRRAVTKYQLLFRHLFLVKFVERRLHTVWAEQQSTKELDVRRALGLAFCVRHKMQHFLATYIYYMMFEVVEPHWHVLQTALRTGEGVEHLDDVIRMHQEFQDCCLKECLLTDQSILKILNKILVVCLLFVAYMEQATQELSEAAARVQYPGSSSSSGRRMEVEDLGGDALFIPATDGEPLQKRGNRSVRRHENSGKARRERMARQTAEVQARAAASGFSPAMEAFAKNLDFYTEDFMRRLWEDSRSQYQSNHLSNLLGRLDYNGYFSAKFS